MKKQNQKGITLIALIITIIVMLILVGVTVAVALNGGIFGKGEKAAFQTSASTVKEQLELEKASRVMENDGKKLEDYSEIKVGDLSGIDEKTRTEFGNKIVLNKNGDVCYNPANVTDEEEKSWLEEIGIQKYTEINEGETYTFTIAEIMQKGRTSTDMTRVIPVADFWPENVSDELKNNAFNLENEGIFYASNLTCKDSRIINPHANGYDADFEGGNWTIFAMLYNGEVWISVSLDNETIEAGYIRDNNYIGSGFENLEITIGLPE